MTSEPQELCEDCEAPRDATIHLPAAECPLGEECPRRRHHHAFVAPAPTQLPEGPERVEQPAGSQWASDAWWSLYSQQYLVARGAEPEGTAEGQGDEALRAAAQVILDGTLGMMSERDHFVALSEAEDAIVALVKRERQAAVRFVEAKNFGAMGPRLAGTGKTFDEVVDEITARTMERLEASR